MTALDLRISKVDDSINRYHSTNVLGSTSSTSRTTNEFTPEINDWLPQPPKSPSPPLNYGTTTRSGNDLRWHPREVSPPTTSNSTFDFIPSDAYKLVEAATNTLRFDRAAGIDPYAAAAAVAVDHHRNTTSFIKSEPVSPTLNPERSNILRQQNSRLPGPPVLPEKVLRDCVTENIVSRNPLVMRPDSCSRQRHPSKTSFLHHVLQQRMVAKQQNSQHHRDQQLSSCSVKKIPVLDSINASELREKRGRSQFNCPNEDLDRRMARLNRNYNAERVPPILNYSPPPSPTKRLIVPPSLHHNNLGFDRHNHYDLSGALRHRQFLMKQLQQHHTKLEQSAYGSNKSDVLHRGYSTSPPRCSPPPLEPLSPELVPTEHYGTSHETISTTKGRRGRPRKNAIKVPLPPLYVFIRNLLHNQAYNPRVISWVSETQGIFKVNSTSDFAKTWGLMKSNRNEEMTYEKMSRAMRYHYGSEKQGRKGHLAMVKEKRLVYRFGELAINWRTEEVLPIRSCQTHDLCRGSMCLWRKE